MDASVQQTLSPSGDCFPGFTPNSPEEKWLEETLKASRQRGQDCSPQTPSSATRQLFNPSPSPPLAKESPPNDAPRATLPTVVSHTTIIAKKKAEITAAAAAAAAATKALAAIEATTAGLSLDENTIHPDPTNPTAAALQQQSTQQEAARLPATPTKQEHAQLTSPLTAQKAAAGIHQTPIAPLNSLTINTTAEHKQQPQTVSYKAAARPPTQSKMTSPTRPTISPTAQDYVLSDSQPNNDSPEPIQTAGPLQASTQPTYNRPSNLSWTQRALCPLNSQKLTPLQNRFKRLDLNQNATTLQNRF